MFSGRMFGGFMAYVITCVDRGSPAEKFGIRAGDKLVRVGGNQIRDVFDLMFHSYEDSVEVELERGGKSLSVRVLKREGENLGLGFETYLMDKPRSCANNCIFCFIDQMPPGMRESLYFKDDDARLSFLQGNYITMTNLSERDVERIIKMRISPVNISVHTTNLELRVKMLGNKRAGKSLEYLSLLARSGISVNAQIVLCPGYNDGAELEKTLCDLYALCPGINSVSVVPVGITRYREGLCDLRQITEKEAEETIRLVDAIGERCLDEGFGRVFYCSDEIYITARRELPAVEFYEEFPQIENGVGMAALFTGEFRDCVERLDRDTAAERFTLATGVLFEPILSKMVDLLRNKCNNISGDVAAIKNKFFGESITVSGLITGRDLIEGLRGREITRLIIPSDMLRSGEDVFLDDTRVADVERELGVRVYTCSSAASLVDVIVTPTR
jgi:putative radical SAM enzyme (TIGR03279 family)